MTFQKQVGLCLELGSDGDGGERPQHLLGLGGQTGQEIRDRGGASRLSWFSNNQNWWKLSFVALRCKNPSGSPRLAWRCPQQERLSRLWWSSARITRSSSSPTLGTWWWWGWWCLLTNRYNCAELIFVINSSSVFNETLDLAFNEGEKICFKVKRLAQDHCV